MTDIAEEVDTAAGELTRRAPEQFGKIVRNRYVMHNVPVVAGTRIPTASIWDFHEAGYVTEAIMREYPTLKVEDIDAALEYERGQRSEKPRRVG